MCAIWLTAQRVPSAPRTKGKWHCQWQQHRIYKRNKLTPYNHHEKSKEIKKKNPTLHSFSLSIFFLVTPRNENSFVLNEIELHNNQSIESPMKNDVIIICVINDAITISRIIGEKNSEKGTKYILVSVVASIATS